MFLKKYFLGQKFGGRRKQL